MDIDSKEIASRIGKRLSDAISEKGITARELSKRTGISEQDISHYRKGKYAPKRDRIFRMATVLGVSPSWLMGLDVERKVVDEVDYLWNNMTERQREQAIDYMRYLVARGDNNEEEG